MKLIPLEILKKSILFYPIEQRFLMGLKAVITLFLVWIFLGAFGCQKPNKQSSSDRAILPPDIAGTWKAQDSPWKIVLSPDGKVSSAVIPMGEIEIKPNRTTKVKMKDGSISTFTTGDCVVEYTPINRELYVCIEMEKIHIKFLDNVITGNSTDRFVGSVSQEGRFWMADWITVFDYGPSFPQEPNDIAAKPLVFEKVETEQKTEKDNRLSENHTVHIK